MLKSILKNLNKRRLIIALAILVVVLVVVFMSNGLKNRLLETNVSQLKFQTGVEYDTIGFEKDVLIINNEGILALGRSGRERWKTVCAATAPMLDIEGKNIMLADMNGKDVNVYKEDKLIRQIRTEKEILSAKLNKNGYVAVATSDLGYKGLITVYDKNGTEVFKWHSGTGYVGGMDMNSNDSIEVAQIMTDRDKVYSKIIRIDMKKNGEVVNVAECDGIVMDIRAYDNGSFIAVSDKGAYGFTKGGKSVFNVAFGGRILQSYNIENKNNLVFMFDNGRNGSLIECYSAKGKIRGYYDAAEEIRAFDVDGECIVLAVSDKILKVTPGGKLKKEIKFTHDVRDIEIFGNRDRVIIVGGNNAEMMKI